MSNSNAGQWGSYGPGTPLPEQPTLTPEDIEAFRTHTRTDEECLDRLDGDDVAPPP